jgi:hypothetical protein
VVNIIVLVVILKKVAVLITAENILALALQDQKAAELRIVVLKLILQMDVVNVLLALILVALILMDNANVVLIRLVHIIMEHVLVEVSQFLIQDKLLIRASVIAQAMPMQHCIMQLMLMVPSLKLVITIVHMLTELMVADIAQVALKQMVLKQMVLEV